MPASEKEEVRDRFLKILEEAAIAFPTGPDSEVSLEAMIEASRMLTERWRGNCRNCGRKAIEKPPS